VSTAGPVRVVGVAVIDDGPQGRRVLAGRRTAPPETAGGWELPGGKCAEGEPLSDAAVREVHEELGCEVRITGQAELVVPIRPGLTLEVVTAELVGGRPVAREHDALRWLGPDELDELPWLPADLPFLPFLRTQLGEDA
jgi:8-oxo-dGTP diphosphatase